MNALEHIAFVLSHAVEADEVSKAQMRRHLSALHNAAYKVSNTKGLEALSIELGKQYEHVIYPLGAEGGEQ